MDEVREKIKDNTFFQRPAFLTGLVVLLRVLFGAIHPRYWYQLRIPHCLRDGQIEITHDVSSYLQRYA